MTLYSGTLSFACVERELRNSLALWEAYFQSFDSQWEALVVRAELATALLEVEAR